MALQEDGDVVDFEKRDQCLWLSVDVEDLPDVRIAPGPVGVAATVLSVVGDHHELEHIVLYVVYPNLHLSATLKHFKHGDAP